MKTPNDARCLKFGTATTVGATLAAATLAAANLAQAQEPARTSQPVLEEVIVTATKRETTLQDTAIAISVMSGDQMTFRDIDTIDGLQNAVPGMTVGEVAGTPLITIRGIGLNLISGSGNPGVATHYDGIYLPRPGSANGAVVDVGSVEVLRGPQGTLYGRNATGGSVNFLSRRPADEFGAGLTLGGGKYDRQFYEGYVEGSILPDTLGARAWYRKDEFNGYGNNETNNNDIGGNDTRMGHLAFTYQPIESLDIYGSYTRRDDKGKYPYSTALTSVSDFLGTEYPTSDQSFEPYNIKGLRDPSTDMKTETGNVTITWDFAGYTLKSISGYVGHHRDEAISAPEIQQYVVYTTRNETSDAYSQEFDLSGNLFDDKVNWLVGAYFQDDDGTTPYGAYVNLNRVLGPYTLVYAPASKTKDVTKALFIDGSWSMWDDLRLIFGARYSDEKRELTQTYQPYVADTATQLPNADLTEQFLSIIQPDTCTNEHHSIKFSSTDPKIGLQWDVTPDIMAYVQYQSGFKGGGFNTSAQCNQTYDPENVDSYEIGLKSTLLDGQLVVNMAAFDYDYKDYQVEKTVQFNSLIENATNASSRGFELSTSFIPVEWVSLDAEYSYLDATYDDYEARDNFQNTSAFLPPDAPIEDLSGNYLSRSPKNTLNVGANFFANINRFGLGRLQLRVEGFYSDKLYFREFNLPIEKQPSYHTYNAFLTVESANEKFSVSVYAKNIGDELYQVGQIGFDAVKYRGAYYAPPRTVGASISMRY